MIREIVVSIFKKRQNKKPTKAGVREVLGTSLHALHTFASLYLTVGRAKYRLQMNAMR